LRGDRPDAPGATVASREPSELPPLHSPVVAMFYVRLLGAVAGFLLASIYGVSIAIFRRDRSLVARDYARALVRLIRPPLGLQVEVAGRERLEVGEPCVYVANHQSAFDVPVLAELYPAHTVVIGKKELKRIPFFGWLYTRTGNVLIDRASNPAAVQRLRAAESAIRERGVSVWIFPEGTRGRGTGELLPFKKGAFYMAVAAEAPIVPVVASPLRALFDMDRRRIRPGRVEVKVLEAVPTKGMTEEDVPRLLADVWNRMARAHAELHTTTAD
jgi:1-acyl-sn-glycerol-3-phosphate acyltransferase